MRQANRRRPAAALTHAPEPPVGETPPAGPGLPPPLRSVRSAALERGLLLLQERLGRVLVVAGLRALVLEDGLPFQRGRQVVRRRVVEGGLHRTVRGGRALGETAG